MSTANWNARPQCPLNRLGSSSADARLDGYIARCWRSRARRGSIPPCAPGWGGLLALLQSEVRFDVGRMKAEPGLREALLFVESGRANRRASAYLGGDGK